MHTVGQPSRPERKTTIALIDAPVTPPAGRNRLALRLYQKETSMKTPLIAAAILAVASPSFAGIALFDQMFQDQIGSVWGSQLNADPMRNWRTFDNFTLGANSDVTHVDWSGYLDFRDGSVLEYAPITAIVGFQITFYEHDGVTQFPGAVVADQLILNTNVLEIDFGLPTSQYAATLNAPVSLLAGTQYWMSVAAVLPNPEGAVLLWNGGAGGSPIASGDAYSAFDAGVDGIDGSRNLDMLFRLRGVPTPGAAALFALAGVVAIRRRRA